jgi:hypothetical protein
MRRGVAYWQKELEEWDNFLFEFADKFSNAELHAVMCRISAIDNIIDSYIKPTSFHEKERKRKQMLKEAW